MQSNSTQIIIMKKILIFSLLLCSVLSVSADRKKSERSEAEREADRKEMVLRQANNLAERMQLDDATADWFVALYQEYNDSINTVRKSIQLPKESKIDEISDLDAEQMIVDQLRSEEQQVAVKRSFLPKFKERLTAQQILRIFAPASAGRQRDGGSSRNGFPGGGPGGFPGGGFPGGGFPGGGPF